MHIWTSTWRGYVLTTAFLLQKDLASWTKNLRPAGRPDGCTQGRFLPRTAKLRPRKGLLAAPFPASGWRVLARPRARFCCLRKEQRWDLFPSYPLHLPQALGAFQNSAFYIISPGTTRRIMSSCMEIDTRRLQSNQAPGKARWLRCPAPAAFPLGKCIFGRRSEPRKSLGERICPFSPVWLVHGRLRCSQWRRAPTAGRRLFPTLSIAARAILSRFCSQPLNNTIKGPPKQHLFSLFSRQGARLLPTHAAAASLFISATAQIDCYY